MVDGSLLRCDNTRSENEINSGRLLLYSSSWSDLLLAACCVLLCCTRLVKTRKQGKTQGPLLCDRPCVGWRHGRIFYGGRPALFGECGDLVVCGGARAAGYETRPVCISFVYCCLLCCLCLVCTVTGPFRQGRGS